MVIEERAASRTHIKRIDIHKRWPWIALAVGALLFTAFAFYNLQYSPVTWFDEGEHLRVPKTLLQYGQYAVWSADGFRYFGPTVGVGPTVLLPVAFVFKVAGIGLVQGRTVIVLYMLVATALYGLFAVRLWGSKAFAACAGLLLFAAPGIAFFQQGRQVLGETPALAFFLGGLVAWNKALDLIGKSERRGAAYGWVIAASGLWALAAITKSTYGLLMPPVLVVLWLANHFYYRQTRLTWLFFFLPAAIVVGGMAAWYMVVLFFLGGSDFATNVTLLRNAAGGSAFVFAPQRIASALKFLLGPDAMFGLAIPGLLYGLWLVRPRTMRGFQLASPLAFSILWLGWFAFASIGWPRYSFPALVLCTLFSARLLWDAPALLAAAARRPHLRRFFSAVVLIAVTFVLFSGLAPVVSTTLQVDDSPQQLAAYLNTHVSQNALIETWESELGFLTDNRYHYPPPELLDKAVRSKWLADTKIPPLPDIYHPENLYPDYLIEGAFARWNALYPPQLLAERYTLIAQFGSYSLYQRRT